MTTAPDTDQAFDWEITLTARNPATGKTLRVSFKGRRLGGIQPWLIRANPPRRMSPTEEAVIGALFVNPLGSPIADVFEELQALNPRPLSTAEVANARWRRTGDVADLARAIPHEAAVAQELGFGSPPAGSDD